MHNSSPDNTDLPDRRHTTEKNRRSRIRRIITLAISILLLFTISIPITGYYFVFVKPLQETALIINEKTYSWNDYLVFTKMLISEGQNSGTWDPNSLSNLIFDVIDELERLEIIDQYAPAEGVNVDPEELAYETKIRVLGRSAVNDPSVCESEFEERYRRKLDLLKIDKEIFSNIVYQGILRRNLDSKLRDEIPQIMNHRHLYVIQLDNRETAKVVLERIDSGESFQDVAKDISKDTPSAKLGGDIGWIPKGIRLDYDAVIFDLHDGEISEPQLSRSGYSLFKAEGNIELQDLTDAHLSTLQSAVLNTWIADHRVKLIKESKLKRPGGGISSERYNWIVGQLTQERELFPRRTFSD